MLPGSDWQPRFTAQYLYAQRVGAGVAAVVGDAFAAGLRVGGGIVVARRVGVGFEVVDNGRVGAVTGVAGAGDGGGSVGASTTASVGRCAGRSGVKEGWSGTRGLDCSAIRVGVARACPAFVIKSTVRQERTNDDTRSARTITRK